ncbi:FecR family protein [Parapedobacter sp. 10938]|uniref:FecR family protein n=1 Tax=Parapedobacter flavus TaxID=3110225 RepID=UPI002DB74140|nr:FecR domain-containing protein [Parapedobacter sp. 10938]MEC3878234.1 FecR domain-containing protein [Parapedobacter sp. 10938]
MHDNERHALIGKYLSGTATKAEEERLLAWYRRRNDGEEVVWDADTPDGEHEVRSRMLARITAHARLTVGQQPLKRFRRTRAIGIAAALLVGLSMIGVLAWYLGLGGIRSQQVIAIAPVKQVENRFIILPDSSRVLLRPGSTLVYRSDFKGATREVALTGEGYFDIRKQENKPFIIHTGKLKTTVLGTAFTIKTDKHQHEVSVTVQRGKVKVEDDKQVLAELTANQQMVYDADAKRSQQEAVVAVDELQWTHEDMRFDAMPFSELTTRLERRYGIAIRFAHEGLGNCPVSGLFRGTETLDEVLDILCATRNASYTKTKDGQVLIDGTGCRLQQG